MAWVFTGGRQGKPLFRWAYTCEWCDKPACNCWPEDLGQAGKVLVLQPSTKYVVVTANKGTR